MCRWFQFEVRLKPLKPTDHLLLCLSSLLLQLPLSSPFSHQAQCIVIIVVALDLVSNKKDIKVIVYTKFDMFY
ncbi:unnamed protein product [Lactuca virosa]|uniref:Uncharacterized protein n=1 Tax=Lactuca virosa TaxID=75947 RepID=A0AAU9LWM3_9ASTR|nr:unnamed protein product [Lactuca virosa]